MIEPRRIGFTGSRRSRPPGQRAALDYALLHIRGGANWEADSWLHHGDCVGSDALAHQLAYDLGYRIALHPPTDPRFRAYCNLTPRWRPDRDAYHEPRPYLVRDRAIVEACRVLIATPHEATYQRRSGTWYTIRQAEAIGRPVYIIRPDASIQRLAPPDCPVPPFETAIPIV